MSAEPGAPQRTAGRSRTGPLLILGLGHVGLAVAREAVDAGLGAVAHGARPDRVRHLIAGLAADDPAAAVLGRALATGGLRITDDATAWPDATSVVVTPDGSPVDPAQPGPCELAAVALAPRLRSGALVVLSGWGRPGPGGEVFASTLELLTGLRAGPDYSLGFAIGAPAPVFAADPSAATVVSGVDLAAATRTRELLHGLGRTTVTVSPVRAAELVARLRHALTDRGPWTPDVVGP